MGLRIPRGNRLRKRVLSAWKWAGYKAGLNRLPFNPDRMYLESTNACNLGCIMCPNGLGQMTRPRGFMDYDLFRQIVDEMAGRVQVTTLHIWGEPLLHPRLPEMIRYCSSKGLRSEISTNATLLTDELSREVLDAGLGAMYMCLDGASATTYEQVRRRADYEQTRQNILRFLRLQAEMRRSLPQTTVQIIEMKPTKGEVEEFARIWREAGASRVAVKPFDSWGGQVDAISELRTEEVHPLPRRYPCPNLWFHVHIYWDGTLVCCDRDFEAKYPLGNVAGGVMKAWNGPGMVEVRRKHRARDLADVPSCSNCTEWSWWKPSPFQSFGNRPQD